jgi:hypothetical protein
LNEFPPSVLSGRGLHLVLVELAEVGVVVLRRDEVGEGECEVGEEGVVEATWDA